jgi:hypothetical protein
MMTASFNDIEMAQVQGGIASITLGNTKSWSFSSGTTAKQADSIMFKFYAMLLVSSALFGGALYRYVGVKRESSNMKEPLIPNPEAVVA